MSGCQNHQNKRQQCQAPTQVSGCTEKLKVVLCSPVLLRKVPNHLPDLDSGCSSNMYLEVNTFGRTLNFYHQWTS